MPKKGKEMKKYKKGQTVYFLTSFYDWTENAISKGQITKINQDLVKTIGKDKLGRKCTRKISLHNPSYNIRSGNNYFCEVDYYQLFTSKKVAIKFWLNNHFFPQQDKFQRLLKYKDKLDRGEI